MRIRWLDNALSDLIEIRKFIAADKPQTANKVAGLIRKSVEPLAGQPALGDQEGSKERASLS